jgi:tetratricopeptide (TPR) repeat protein
VPKRPLRVFRDESDFTGGEYSAALDRNLRNTSKLMVICSPNSRASKAVNQEVERFSAYRGTENIIPVLLAGVPNNNAKPEQEDQKAFPEALVQRLAMPLAADYRGIDGHRDRPTAGRYEPAWHKLLADVYADYRVTRDQVAGAEARRDVARRRTFIAGTAAVVLGLSVLAGWALFERAEAVRQREEVERQREEVQKREERLKEAINRVTDDLRKRDPGPAVLEAAYKNNFELLNELFKQNVTGPMLDLPMAVNVLNLADILVQQGRLDEAADYLNMIPGQHETLPQAEQSDPDWLERLALAYDRIADIAGRQGDAARAEEQYRAAFKIRSEQVAAAPENFRWQLLLASSQQQLCALDVDQVRLESARRQCMTALDSYRRLAQHKDAGVETRAGEIWTRLYLADATEEGGRLPETLEQLTAAELLVGGERGSLQLELLALHERRGRVFAAMHDFHGAIAEANAALRLGEALSKHKEDADSQRNLAILRHDIAMIYRDSGRPLDGARQFAEACAVVERLRAQDDKNIEWRRLLAQCLSDSGEARLLAGDPQGALADLMRALAMQQELAASGDEPGRKRDLASCHRKLGDWYAKRGAHTIALEKYLRAQQLLEPLKRKAGDSRKLDEELAELDARIGAARRATRDAAAIESYRRAVDGYRALAAHDPSNARWQKGLAESSRALEALQKPGPPDSRS